ncbi:ATP-binding protein [Aliiglaciecola sp. LCG003]|uniref:ATP-binding protein n=1 Tax=Aliiglaciecola sp. LCG003 TaxID=3053655 RepID=UPI00257370F0|nr:ATP-binding protein [Aliiglaciecola sp. LCG003]WJG11247.1 ATP-binding protein [Aliiglaciecola sp. LCG003]
MLMVAAGGWLVQHNNSSYSIRPLDAESAKRLQRIANRFELIADKNKEPNLSLLLSRAGQKYKSALLLINEQNREFVYGFPRAWSPTKAPFMELIDQQQKYVIRTNGGVFHGPEFIQINGNGYHLFVGKPFKKDIFRQLWRQNPAILVATALIISGILCALFAWSLVRPIRELQNTARNVSKGNLESRVTFANHRGDELGQLGKDFNIMSQQIGDLMGSQKRLVADISHELRSPLARLQLAIGIAQNHPEELTDNIQKQLLRIEKEAIEIDHMIEQVLKLSRLEANAPGEQKQKVSLLNLLSKTFNDAKFEAKNAGKKVYVETIPDINLICFPELLTSAVRNIINNGIKYCTTKVEVSFLLDGNTLILTVIDDGHGVPESELSSMFKPFYRLSASRNRNTGGVGLGLAIVKQAIETHNGQITAQNNLQHGLTIRVEIPMG